MSSRTKSSRPQSTRSAHPVLLSPDEVRARLNQLTIVDVQNPKYATSLLPKAQRLNVDVFLKDLPKGDPVVLTCLVGQRSFTVAQQLLQMGYRSIYVLKGGVTAWKQAGYTVQLTKIPALSAF